MLARNIAMASAPDAGPVDQVRARLRLKRLFLWGMVSSLSTCAAIAVIVLLVGEFNDTTARILGTLGALAFHSGVAMACAASLERRRWPALSLVGLVTFGANCAVLLTFIWWPQLTDWGVGRALLTTAALTGYYIVAIPGAALREHGRFVRLAVTGLAACVVGFLMLLACIWAESSDNEAFAKATAIVAISAFSLAQTCLLVRVPVGLSLDWLRRGMIACVWAVAAVGSAIIVWEPREEFPFRFLGALGVMDASGSLALVILAKLRQVQGIEKLESTAARLEIRCPRCTTPQTVGAGASQCTACGLKFGIEIQEPRCVKCDYLLWQLPERRCPECGTPF